MPRSPVGNLLILYVVIGLLVAGALLGPLIAVVPSKRQRYLAAQREAATGEGLSVRLRPLPEIPPRFRFSPPHEHMTYEQRIDPRHRAPLAVASFVRGPEGWQPLEPGQSVPAAVAAMPEGVFLVLMTEQVVSAAWDESGGPEAVSALAARLGELHEPK